MLSNKDKGTSVGFSNDCLLKKYEDNQWQENWELFKQSEEFEYCLFKDLLHTYIQWLIRNYFAPVSKYRNL